MSSVYIQPQAFRFAKAQRRLELFAGSSKFPDWFFLSNPSEIYRSFWQNDFSLMRSRVRMWNLHFSNELKERGRGEERVRGGMWMWWLHVDKNKITGRGRSWIRVVCTKSFLRHPKREHSVSVCVSVCVHYEYQSSLLNKSSFINKINCRKNLFWTLSSNRCSVFDQSSHWIWMNIIF